MPRYRPSSHHQFLSLLLLLTCLAPSTAIIQCFHENPDTAPKLSDCRHILAHLPSIAILDDKYPSDAFTSANPSSPFFPNALFAHNSCHIEFRFGKFPKQTGFSMRFKKMDAMETWTSMRQDAVGITERCVSARRTGFARGKIVGTGAYYSVQIRNLDERTALQRQSQWRAIEVAERWIMPAWGLDFWEPIYVL